MGEGALANRVRSSTSGTPARSPNNVRGHHFVIDEPPCASGPGEEIGPAEPFLAGVSACGVLVMETFARKESIAFQRAEAVIEAMGNTSNTSRFERIQTCFRRAGPARHQAEGLLEPLEGR